MYAMLGDVRFELLTSFTDFEETHAASFAKHEVLAGRPRLQAMGNDLTQIRLSLKLHWRLGNVDAAYQGLMAAKESQQAQALVFGSGRFVGWFVIERLSSRTLIQDGHGRTAARELDVSLTEFVGDPNNPLPTPGLLAGGQNPLLAMLPESIQPQISHVAQAVQTGVRVYRAVSEEVGKMQDIITRAKAGDSVLSLLSDALSMGDAALGKLAQIPEVSPMLSHLDGASEWLAFASQATRELSDGINQIRNAAESNNPLDWLDTAANLLEQTSASLEAGQSGAQSLTAWLASRKDGV